MAKRKFSGSNNLAGSKKLFNEKARYMNYAIPQNIISSNPGLFRDFWFIENMYYGKIDRAHNFIFLKSSKIKTVAGNSVFLADFVADALEDFLKAHEKALSTGKIQKDDEFLSDITVDRGYNSILTEYDLHMNKLRNLMHKPIMKNHFKIENFDDFVRFFMEYSTEVDKENPITFTGFVASRMSSLATTGLFADVSSLKYDKDSDKINNFIDKPNFKFFIENCLRHGFMIDYNVPWRLCANIGSPEMEKYMLRYGATSHTILDQYYEKTFTRDMDYFMNYMLKFYNRFVSYKPNIRRERVSNINDGLEIYRYVEKRISLTKEMLNNKYESSYRIKLYIDIRNHESKQRYDSTLVNTIKANALEHLKIESITKAYEYINHQFIGFLNDPYAYNGFAIREDVKKNNERMTGQDLQELLDASVTESRGTLY